MRISEYDRLKVESDGAYFITNAYAKMHANGYKQWPSNDARVGWISRVPERK
jgi:hypothetical protein